MNLGGIVADALKLIYGNVDIMVFITGFSIFITLVLVTKEIYERLRL